MIQTVLRRYLLIFALASGALIFAVFHFIPALAPLKPPLKAAAGAVLPYMIFLILFTSFCKVEIRGMKPRAWHLYLCLFQVGMSLLLMLYLYLVPDTAFSVETEGAIVCLLTPTAAAAAVITGKLGGSESALTTYTIISNFAAALFIPAIFTFLSPSAGYSFLHEFYVILSRVFPLLVLPLFLAIGVRYCFKRVHRFIVNELKDVSFYLWGLTLVTISAEALSNIVNSDESSKTLILSAVVGLVTSVIQFSVGKLIGHVHGQRITAGQGLGQKNMVFGIWVSYTYLSPAAAIAPGTYILWQNLINSWQMWYKDRFDAKRKERGLPEYHE